MALTIPGLMHICHNLATDLTKGMNCFPICWARLCNAEALLTHGDRMRRMQHYFGARGQGNILESALQGGIPELYEKRWGCIQSFLHKSKPVLLLLRQLWTPNCITSADSDPKKEPKIFKPDLLTETLRSNMWFSYFNILEGLHNVVMSLCSWGEGCHCHEPLIKNKSRYLAYKAMECDFGESHHGCPLQGMRFRSSSQVQWQMLLTKCPISQQRNY